MEKTVNKIKYSRIANFICAALMLLLVAALFLPYWKTESGESKSTSVAEYFWSPRDHKDVTKDLTNLYLDIYGKDLKGKNGKAFKFTANEILVPALIIFVSTAATIILCIFLSKKPLSATAPLVGGAVGIYGYLTNPALRIGQYWTLHLALCIAITLVAGIGLTGVYFQIRAFIERQKKYSQLNQYRTWKCRELYLMVLPALIALIVFSYIPMYGIIMGFQDVKIGNPFGQNEWIGIYHFKRFFSSYWFDKIIRNTVVTSIVSHLLLWPIPIILALLLHNSTVVPIKKVSQMTSYLPHLLSTVVVISIVNLFCNGESGLINILLKAAGKETISFFGKDEWVLPMFAISGVWTSAGYSAIVYLGALSAVDDQLMEAARIDGASKLQCIWHIQIPTILPTIVTMLILSMGSLFSLGAEKMLLLQTDLNLNASELISTYVYKSGMTNAQYGFATAVGLFQNIVNLIMVISVNTISRKVSDTSII